MSPPVTAKIDLFSSLDPWQAARSCLSLSGRVALADLPRVAEQLFDRNGLENRSESCREQGDYGLDYRLEFRREDGRALCVGHLTTRLRLQCQRCLDVVEIPVDAPIRLALMPSALGMSELPDDLDAVEVIDQRVRPADLLEDELLLAIPGFPRHPQAHCSAPRGVDDAPDPRLDSVEQRQNPFAVLGRLATEVPGDLSARGKENN